jgi:hypothetical protein
MLHYVDTDVYKTTRWIEHQKSIAIGMVVFNKKATTCYSGLMIEVCFKALNPNHIKGFAHVDYPKPPSVQEKEKKKILSEQSREASIEVVTKEQFINECHHCALPTYRHNQFINPIG